MKRVREGGRQHADFPSEEISSRSDFAPLSLRERNRARSVLTGTSSPPIPHPYQFNIDISLIPVLAMVSYEEVSCHLN